MPTYTYQGIDVQGRKKEGYLGAINTREARQKIAQSNIDLLSLKKARIKTETHGNSKNFFLYMGHAIQANSNILDTLHTVQKSFSGEWKLIIQSIIDQVRQGKSLSVACAHYDIFPPFVPSILDQGEKTGGLGPACHTCYELIEEINKNKESLIKSFAQQALNLFFFLLSFFMLITYFVPSLSTLFEQENITKPLSMRVLIFMSKHLFKGFFFLSLGIVLFTKKKNSIPLFKKIHLQRQYLSFFSSLSYLCQSHIPIVDALDNIKKHEHNKQLSALSFTVLNAIKKGKSLSQAADMLPHLSKFYVQIIASGEYSNKQNESLNILVKIMQHDNKKILERFIFWMGPLVLLLMSLGIWTMIRSTFIPLYHNMNSLFYV